MSAHMTPEQVRSKIDHPIVDGDGHWVEYDPVFSDKMRKVGGNLAADGFLKAMGTTREALSMSVAERRHKRIGQQAFWTRQADNTLDRATAIMPKLLYDRLDELGLDFVVVYPTAGLRLPRIQDDATRRAVIRAYNIVSANYFSGLGARLPPAAIIPMHTPEEAIDELEFVTKQLGSKVGMFGSNMARKVPAAAANDPDTARFAVWYDVLGLDSDYDYDPVWAKCVELGIAPTFHSTSSSQGLRLSPTNFTYNHIGHFAAAGHATAKAIFLGGVTRRFPELRFAFLEGGVGWASQLFGADLGPLAVIAMRHPLPEAYELVEDGHITADNLRDFTFANAVKLWGTQNPRFFEGTRVAREAAAILAAAQTPTLVAAE